MPSLKSGIPWKGFFYGTPEWDRIRRIPGNPLKVWLCHWIREHSGRRDSWPSLETLVEETDLNLSTVKTARKWLVGHGWLVPVGHVPARHGHFAVPKFRVECGTVDEKSTSDGRRNNQLGRGGKNHPRTGSGISSTDGVENFNSELYQSSNHSKGESDNCDQSSNQPINPSRAVRGEGKNPNPTESLVGTKPRETPNPSEGMLEMKLMGIDFPGCDPTEENLAMYRKILKVLAEKGITLDDIMSFNAEHQDGGMRIRSLRQGYNAIVNGNGENGLVMQLLSHDETCRKCVKRMGAK